MNCFALTDARALLICWLAIWFTFILMCLQHQENSWDSRRKCLCFGVQPELRSFMFHNQRTTSFVRKKCLNSMMGLKCHSYQDFVKFGSSLCISLTNTITVGSLPRWGGSDCFGQKCPEGNALSFTSVTLLQLHSLESKKRMFEGEWKVQLSSALCVCESNSGKLCFSLPAPHYCCLPISSVIIYLCTNETWMFLITIQWTAGVNILVFFFGELLFLEFGSWVGPWWHGYQNMRNIL